MINTEVEVIITKDDSKTLFSKKYGQHYHSLNGAISESNHIFLNLGLRNFTNQNVSILEIGYGTGLNALLTYFENLKLNNKIYYHGIDVFKVSMDVFEQLEYLKHIDNPESLSRNFCDYWEQEIEIDKSFVLYKNDIDFNIFEPMQNYDIIYFDAFSPEIQPQMWEYFNLKKIVEKINKGGFFVTYCSKGVLKQNLRNLGLEVKRYSGPIGKRHVICALKK